MIKEFWKHFHYKCPYCNERYWITTKTDTCILCGKEPKLISESTVAIKANEVYLDRLDTLVISKQINNPDFFLDYFTGTYVDKIGRVIIGCFREKDQVIKFGIYFGFSGKKRRITIVEHDFSNSKKSLKVIKRGVGWGKYINEYLGS